MNLSASDQALVAELYEKNKAAQPPFNPTIGRHIKATYTHEQLGELEHALERLGTLTIPTVDGRSVEIDGKHQPVSFVAATEITDTNHGDMASMLYLRDHIQTASVYLELNFRDPTRYEKEGQEGRLLLMSALHLMSTPAQLERFHKVTQQGQGTQEDWPHISLLFDDLEGREANGWRNKQDSFQMLAYLVCEALERGIITTEELSKSHRAFLGSVTPLLTAVGFPLYENSGSWEEIAARRTSVMAIETALLDKILRLSKARPELQFLCGTLDHETIAAMRLEGLREIGKRLPFESPDYASDSVKFRRADAALAYVLMYGIPELLAKEKIPTGPHGNILSTRHIETLLLNQLAALDDGLTNGLRRYENDSYQRVNFHTETVQGIITGIKRTVKEEATNGEIDLDKKQRLRDELTPPGREAAWTHPLGQLSAWAAKRSLEERGDEAVRYRALATTFLNRQLGTITGDNQWHAVLNGTKRYVIQKVPAAKLPECYVTYQTPDGNETVVPSPHTPLNWSTATLKEAVGLLRLAAMVQ